MLAGTLLGSPMVGQELTVWEDADFRGRSRSFREQIVNLQSIGWNDRISSLRVLSGLWELCRDADFQGCRVVGAARSEISDLSGEGWNDQISSLRPLASPQVAETIAGSLYEALLGRQPSSADLRWAAPEVQRGRTAELVREIVSSPEFRDVQTRLRPEELLDQVYQGLFGRAADASAARAYLPRVERRELSSLMDTLLASDEFQRRLRGTTPMSGSESLCQEEIRALVRRDRDPDVRIEFDDAESELTDRGEERVEGRATIRLDEETVSIGYDCLVDTREGRVLEADYSPRLDRAMDLTARGSGLLVRGNGRYEQLEEARVELAVDRSARLTLTGASENVYLGSWSREDGRVQVRIEEVPGRPRSSGEAFLELSGQNLAQIAVFTGAPSARERTAVAFRVEGWIAPRLEEECLRMVRSRLEDEQGRMLSVLLLAPQGRSLSARSDELRGYGELLEAGRTFEYSCNVDTLDGRVTRVRVERR